MDPFVWIPEVPKWDNYIRIWTKIPLLRFVGNTVFLTIVVTLLQLLTSSFAAYSFAKLEFKHKNGLFWHISPQSPCPGRYTWYLSSS